jgi:DNA primase
MSSLEIEDFKYRHGQNQSLKELIFGELRKSGTKDYKADCAFCGGNDLAVSIEQSIYYCHNCHATGDYFQYVQQTKNCSFQESLAEVAQIAGEDPSIFGKLSEKDIQKSQVRAKKRQVVEELQEIFAKGLSSSTYAQNYLTIRSINIEDAQKAGLGYLRREDVTKVNAILQKAELPLLNQHYGDRLTISLYTSPLGVNDFTYRAIRPDPYKYLNAPGHDKEGFNGIPSIKNAEHLILVEGYLEATLNNFYNRKNRGNEAWLGLGDCHIASPDRLNLLNKLLNQNSVKTITLCLDNDHAGFMAVRDLLTTELLKIARPLLSKLFFFCWDRMGIPEIKDIHDLHEKQGYAYLDYLALLQDKAVLRNIYEQLVQSCFKDTCVQLDSRELEKGTIQLLSAIAAFDSKDLMELDLALNSRFKDNLAALDLIRTRIAEEIEKIEIKNRIDSIKEWSKQLQNCDNIQNLDKLLESPPKKEILTMPIHQEPPTDDYWKNVNNLIQTHYWKLDQYIGYTKGGLHIVAGRPGDGKTATMINLTRTQLCGNPDAKVMFVTLEESAKPLMTKLLLCCSDVILDKDNPTKNYENLLCYLNRGHFLNQNGNICYLDKEKIDRIETAKEWIKWHIAKKKLTIVSPAKHDVENLVKIMAEYNKYFGYDFFFLDYLQMMKSSRTNEQNYLLGKTIANTLSEFALESNAVLVAGAQLNRNSQGRATNRPMLIDLRESGDYEQKACLVVGLSTPKNLTEEASQVQQDTLEVTIIKNREGSRSNDLTLSFKRCTRRINDTYVSY